MNAVDVSGKLEVTSVAVGVAVVTQRAPETVAGTIVESAQVETQNVEPLKGGVQQSGALLDSEVRVSREIVATTVQQSLEKADTLDETSAHSDANRSLVTLSPPSAVRPLTSAEALDLPPQARLGRRGRKPVVSAQVAEQICMLLSLGFSKRQAAGYLGISPMSITNAVSRDPALGEEFRQAAELQNVQPELTIVAEARKNWRAAAWYLTFKTKYPRSLTEEEKEERHQAHLADQRRSAELSQQEMRDFAAQVHALDSERERLRTTPPAEPRRRKRVRGE